MCQSYLPGILKSCAPHESFVDSLCLCLTHTRAHAHTHTCTHIHTYTHVRTHTHTHAHTHTHTHTDSRYNLRGTIYCKPSNFLSVICYIILLKCVTLHDCAYHNVHCKSGCGLWSFEKIAYSAVMK